MVRWLAAVACVIPLAGSLLCAEDADPIRAKLDKARTVYSAEADKVREAVDGWFDKKEQAARSKGDKKVVDQLKADRKTFTEKGILPLAISQPIVQQSVTARAKLEAACRVAVKEFIQAKQDAAATQVEAQLETFRRSAMAVTLAEWVQVRTPGRWRRDHDRTEFHFFPDGKLSEFNAGNQLVSSGKWTIGKNGVGVVPLDNGWSFTFTLTSEDVMSAPAKNPRGRPEGPWGLKRITR